MKPKHVVLTIPVNDLERSLLFYRDGLGLPTNGIEGQTILLDLPGMMLFLAQTDEFAQFSEVAHVKPYNDARFSDCMLSVSIGSRQEVDAILEKVITLGGTVHNAAQEEKYGYTGYFLDPDGHLWQILYSGDRNRED